MIFGDVAATDAAGALLAHAVVVGTTRWAKGRVLSDADVAAAAAAGIATLTVARLEADDVAEDIAATILAAHFVSAGVSGGAAAHGRVNLIADVAGLFQVDTAAVDAVNAADERLTIGTLGLLTRVAAGEVVATIKVIPFSVPQAALAAATAAAMPFHVAAFGARRFVMIQSRLPATTDKLIARTDAVTRARIERLGSRLDTGWVECRHEACTLAMALRDAPSEAIILIAGASATADRHDVIPAAIVAAGGQVERLGMPVDPGNLLCLGELAGRAVIGLPGCARSPKRNGFDWVLERLAAGMRVTTADIAGMGVGGLLPEAERPQPRCAAEAAVGAIVLAAGRSTRMGGANKLLADLDGAPVVAHTVDAIAVAGLPPPVVVVGHLAATVYAALGNRPAITVTTADFGAGMSRSLAAGLAAAPPSWRAVLIVLGDMPRVTPTTIAAIAAAAVDVFSVVVPVFDGRRGNPVAWGRAHWPRLLALSGDVGARSLLDSVAVTEIMAEDAGIHIDIDTPAALVALRT